MTDNILYVVMHGLISLVDRTDEDEFNAYLLDMKNEHAYLFGNWLTEKDIPARASDRPPLDLSLNVPKAKTKSPQNQLDPDLNAIAKLAPSQVPSPADANVRAIFRLPRPQTILYKGIGSLSPNSFTPRASDLLVKEPTQLCSIRIFQYSFQDPTGVFLTATDGSRPWSCPPAEELAVVNDQKVAVLHIYNEPSTSFSLTAARDHNKREFDLSLQFLGLQLKLARNPGPINPSGNTPIPGLYSGEITGLNRRELVVLMLMARARTGDLNFAFDGGGSGGQVCSPGHAIVTSS